MKTGKMNFTKSQSGTQEVIRHVAQLVKHLLPLITSSVQTRALRCLNETF